MDKTLGTIEMRTPIPSHVPKAQKQPEIQQIEPVKEAESYDVWTKVDSISAAPDLPPPATLPYAKAFPALPPSTIRSSQRMLRPRTAIKAVTVAEGGQSYNPSLEDWESLVDRTAEGERIRLQKQARKEWVPKAEEAETPAAEDNSEDEDEDEPSESFLGKPVQVRRKTRAQRNKEARQKQGVLSSQCRPNE